MPLLKLRTCAKSAILAGAIAIAVLLCCESRVEAAATSQPDSSDQLLQYLDHTINWYRQVTSVDQASLDSQEVLYRQSVREDARQSLQLAFEYAKAQARLIGATTAQATKSSDHSQKLAKAMADAAQQVQQIQSQLQQLDSKISSATEDQAPVLNAQRDKLNSEFNLAKARQQVLQNLADFVSGPDTSSQDALLKKIDELEGSVPDAQRGATATAAAKNATAAAPAQPAPHPESSGVIGLFSEMFTLSGRMGELKSLAGQAEKLSQENEKLRQPIRTQWMDSNRQSQALSATQPSDVNQLRAQSQQIDQITAQLSDISAAGLPLGKQSLELNATKTALLQWRALLGRQYDRALRAVLIRVGAIALTVIILLLISRLWTRATYRYVTDQRRRVQFLLVRRIVVTVVIAIVIVAGVVSELSSLATFAGLITAGIAVALQGVILSAAAYFFFIGRYGVRVGDRVTISGVTGDVVETGLMRLYLLELAGSGRDMQPTGRIVVFSNSVLFQNSPFYKQVPGSEYVWNDVALTFSPDTDYHLAEKRMMDAVNSVYNEYKETIERQYANVRDTMHVPIAQPKPEGRMRFVSTGLEFVVRYPVEIRRAAEVNDRITRKLLETIDQDPRLRLVPSGTPTIQSATDAAHAA
jgi:small-conductance mechanosensitive channel